MIDTTNQTGLGFEYEATKDGYVFHIGAATDNTKATVVFSEYNGVADHKAEIKWEDGETEIIVFGSERTDDAFSYEGRGDLIIE